MNTLVVSVVWVANKIGQSWCQIGQLAAMSSINEIYVRLNRGKRREERGERELTIVLVVKVRVIKGRREKGEGRREMTDTVSGWSTDFGEISLALS